MIELFNHGICACAHSTQTCHLQRMCAEREKRMKKTLRSILLIALWVVLCLVPIQAKAEGENPIELTQDNYKFYLELGSYNKSYLPSGSYILMKDITLDDTLLIGCEGQFNEVDFSDVNVTLDLNGYVLRQGNTQKFPVIQVYQGSTLTIQDSRPDAIHKFTADSTGLWKLDEADGDKTVNGGVITGSVKTGLVLQAVDMNKDSYVARCTMNGGNIVGCTHSSYGGGVSVGDKAEFTMNGGSIRGCTATDPQHGFGGGVYVVSGTFTMNGGMISDCASATTDGGDALFMANGVNAGKSSFSMSADATINGSFKDANPGASEGSLGVYTVTFNTDGGSPVTSQVRPQGATAVKPADPTKPGLDFGGWYIGEDAYDFTQPVTKNLTLMAKWTQHIHCLCGGMTYDGHDSHTDISWMPWMAADQLPDKAGNYYLVNDVTLPSGTIALPDGVNLCLNGKTVKGTGASYTKLSINGALTVTDCGKAGSFGDLAIIDGAFTMTGSAEIQEGIFHGNVENNGKITGGTFHGNVKNNGRITGGIFYGTVSGTGTIEDSARITVNFDSDGGSVVAPQKILRGQKATAPAAPAKVGFVFGNWTVGGAAFDFTAPITSDTTLRAAWTLRDHSASTAQPTCTEQATCTVCQGKYGKVLGHSYGKPTYTWNGTSCTAERVCGRDASHKETETVTATVTVTQNRTCTRDELSTYTAVFNNPVFAVQKKENVVTAVRLGHNFKVLQYNGTQHWNKCSRCNEISARGNHTGGTATCSAKAECVVCHAKYGEMNTNNHSGLEKVAGVPATAAATGTREYWRCNACGKLFADAAGKNEITSLDMTLEKLAPTIIEGMNGRWNKGCEDALMFRSDAAYEDFIEVLVDGAVISADNYTAREGSIIVELKADYLASLTEGEHTITIRSASGDATARFTVEAMILAPKTEPEDTAAWEIGAVVILGILIVAVVVFVIHKRKTTETD